MMTPEELKNRLGGVITFPITPFNDDLSLNIEGHRTNVAEMIEFPFCATVAAGGTGEMYSMTPDENFEIIKSTIEEVNGKIPVLAGVGFNQVQAVEMAKKAEEAGADGILCFPPYYPNADREGMLNYYRAIGEATKLGLFIYSRDWAAFSAGEVWRLCEAIPNLIAWKEGQADLRTYQRIMARCGDRLHWIGGIGDDMVPGYYSIGIRTYTSSIAVIAPRLSLQLHERASMVDSAALSRLMSNYVVPLYAIRQRRKGYEVAVMKKAMEILGKPAGPVRPPLVEVRPEEVKEIEGLMERYKPVL